MHRQTGKIHAVLSVMPQPIREGYACWNYNNMVLANTLGEHKTSRRWTWHAPNGIHHSQNDYILVQKRFRSGINRVKTRTFRRADIGSDHDLVMMNFRVWLKKTNKPKNTTLKFNLDKLMDPSILESFQATIGRKFAPLITLDNNLQAMTTTFNAVMIETASDILKVQTLGHRRNV